ncbi:hypothetical protein BD310DRAFT_939010 [Dichomitus squalens]|uniref:Uncharacterized protein n=1 Tax=Dichomitus squalens TaxID=114155 RepID=A0A4Q9PDM7_9APHY|nr:hypothetical protein BD310DRAFT_939010 [Dichomitus squalens]
MRRRDAGHAPAFPSRPALLLLWWHDRRCPARWRRRHVDTVQGRWASAAYDYDVPRALRVVQYLLSVLDATTLLCIPFKLHVRCLRQYQIWPCRAATLDSRGRSCRAPRARAPCAVSLSVS